MKSRWLNAIGGASFGALFGAICSVVLAIAEFSVSTVAISVLVCIASGAGFGALGRPVFWPDDDLGR